MDFFKIKFGTGKFMPKLA